MELYDIENLKKYNDMTTDRSVIMPTEATFDTKVELAIKLWPQINKDGSVAYLFGKGVGVELALRGFVEGREKNDVFFPYRSHSDFEIYNSLNVDYKSIPESKDFVRVFGAQELYPKNKTKGLSDIPDDYMDKTYDVVVYNGNRYLIPELELLFLDKFLRQESTPRKEGNDALLLLKSYKLNIDKIKMYFDRFVKFPAQKKYEKDNLDILQVQNIKLIKMYNSIKEELLEEYDSVSIDDVERKVNQNIDDFRSIPNIRANGVHINLCPEHIKFIEKDGNIFLSEETISDINQLILNSGKFFNLKLDLILSEIEMHYSDIYKDNPQKS